MTQKQISANERQRQGCCFYCAEPTLSVTITRNGKATIAAIACKSCHHEVAVALLSDGGKVAKCPKCFAKATLSLGKRNGGGYFMAFSCSRCGWVASETFMKVASAAFKLIENQFREPTNETSHNLEGVPAPYEAALETAYGVRHDAICPFCRERYMVICTIAENLHGRWRVNMLACQCGYFPTEAVKLPID